MTKTPKPRYKKKGPIRFEAIFPVTIIVALVALYFTLFFDGHLRQMIEWGATKGNGAEVNIADLKTSFWRGSFALNRMELTNPVLPAKNRLQIGEVEYRFSWDALLRAKFVIEIAAIRDIEVNTPRKKPGYVVPPEPDDGKPNPWVAELKAKVIENARSQFNQSPFGELARFIQDSDPLQEVKTFVDNLKTLTYLDQLKGDLIKKEGEWTKAINSLPGEQDVKALEARIATLQVVNGSPQELIKVIPGKIKEAKSLYAEVEQKVNVVQATVQTVTSDVDGFVKQVGGIEGVMNEDRLAIESKLKLPKLDTSNIANQLFGNIVLDQVAKARQYAALARKYMPEKKPDEPDGQIQPHERAKGKSYEFGRLNSYPLFWMKKAEISSNLAGSEFGGVIKGELTHVTSHPSMLGKPTILTIDGEFPKQSIAGVQFKGVFDHTTEVATDSLKLAVAHFPVTRQELSNVPAARLAFNQADGGGGFEGVLKGNDIAITMEGLFRNIQYDVSSESKILNEILQSVTRELPTVNLKAKVHGTWDSMKFALDSNLASGIEAGIAKVLKAKLEEAKKRVHDLIEAKVGPKRKELKDRFDATKTKILGTVDAKKKQALALKSQVEARITALEKQAKDAENAATQKAREEVQKKVGDKLPPALKKKLFK